MSIRDRLIHRVQQELYGSEVELEKVDFEVFMRKTLDILLDEVERMEQQISDLRDEVRELSK